MLDATTTARRLAVALPLAACLVSCDGFLSGPGGSKEAGPKGDPGHVTVHRLNNTEYQNTVRDLLGTSLPLTDDFPADDYSHGFDNIAAALSMSPVQVELYQRAAQRLAAEAMRGPVVEEERRVEAEEVGGTTGQVVDDEAWGFFLPGSLDTTMDLPVPGTYAIRIRAWARQAGPELARMQVSVDGTPVEVFEVDATAGAAQVYELSRELQAGLVRISVAFVNDFFIPEEDLDRNLFVDWVAVRGPAGATGETPIRDRLLVCEPDPEDPEPCVRTIAERFGRRAWRRPLSGDELDASMELFAVALAAGGDVHDGIQLVLEHFLASPHFLFRFEIDPDPTSTEPRRLSDHELASRLSYFLWSSMPDDELFAAADAGELGATRVLRAQIERMLDDPKADAIVENFAGQWLFLRGLEGHDPDYELFPDYDDALRDSMIRETSLFFAAFLDGGLPADEMLTADFSFLDARLAEHYGVPFSGEGFEKTPLAGTGRRGLLGHASILTVTSHPDRTSPVKRGQWVLEQLLCSAPPPPPPGVEGLEADGPLTGSVRERMEQHRSDPVCMPCHEAMDPIGFALEHYDAVGTWRETDGPYPIDATGVLPDGQSFDGAAELAPVLADDPRFTRCLTEKMLTYALGRGIEPFDERAIDGIHRDFLARGASLRDLIALIATSDPFRYRRGETGGEQP